MKAVGFFLAVFLSMLIVFLVATGEIARWLSPSGEVEKARWDVETRGNIVRLEIWNVDLGRRSFTILAELEGTGVQLDRPIEEISEVALRNGTIEVPIYEESGEPVDSAEAKEAEREEAPSLRYVKLDFARAVCRRLLAAGRRRGEFEVVLEKGRGFANDGTEFDFEDLVFSNRPPSESGVTEGQFFISSAKRVSVRNAALEMLSRKGFIGVLESRGLERLRFLPPVSAVMDPSQPSFLKWTGAAPSEASAQEGVAEAGTGKIAIRCGGPLELSFSERRRESAVEASSRLSVKFRRDVVLYRVGKEVGADELPEPTGDRFECQELDLDFGGSGQRVSPQRALATWPGGRVRAVIAEKDPARAIVIEGERIEWRPGKLDDKSSASPEPGGGAALVAGEAILDGTPSLRGPNMSFFAERARVLLDSNRAVLESVRGELEYPVAKEALARSAGLAKAAPKAPKLEPWEDEALPRDDRRPEEKRGVGDGESPKRAALPSRWDLRADEAEFFFSGERSGAFSFSRLVARSKAPQGVVIESRDPDRIAGEAGSPRPPRIRFSGDVLAYSESDRVVTFEGTGGRKPQVALGDDWIEAKRLSAFVDEDVAWLEGEVRGVLTNPNELWSGKSADSDALQGGAPKPASEEPIAVAKVELSAASVAVRRDRETGGLRELWATGGEEVPASITSPSDPWLRLCGPEFLWDQGRRVAQMRGSGSAVPRVEFEEGELTAERIVFDQERWRVQLAGGVGVRVFDRKRGSSDDLLSLRAPKVFVQFYPKLERRGPQGAGAFEHLARIESVQARAAPERPIEIAGRTFLARAQECTWDGGKSELRFFGDGFQEIEVLREDFRGPVKAREISYLEGEDKVVLRGGVRGELIQAPSTTTPGAEVPSSRLQPATATSRDRAGPMPWIFETNELKIWVGRSGAPSGIELRAVEAADKVLLRNEALGLQLRGDDLRYEADTRKIHVFSREGRPQTVFYDRYGSGALAVPDSEERGAKAPPETPAGEKVHRIGSQEIWILVYENPYAELRSGEPVGWLLVEFHRDVMASFYVPVSDSTAPRAKELGDTWKLVADKLALTVDASRVWGQEKSLSEVVPWALATGKVIFNAGLYQATAERAVYEDGPHRLVLSGSPARLTRDGVPVESSPEIVIRKVGDVLEYSPAGRRRASPQPGG